MVSPPHCRTDLSPCPTSAAYPVSGTKCQTSRALSYTRANHPPLSRGPAPREKAAAPEAGMGVVGRSLLPILLLAGEFKPEFRPTFWSRSGPLVDRRHDPPDQKGRRQKDDRAKKKAEGHDKQSCQMTDCDN